MDWIYEQEEVYQEGGQQIKADTKREHMFEKSLTNYGAKKYNDIIESR